MSPPCESVGVPARQDGDGFLSAEELAKGLKDCDIFANVDDIMQVCCTTSCYSKLHVSPYCALGP